MNQNQAFCDDHNDLVWGNVKGYKQVGASRLGCTRWGNHRGKDLHGMEHSYRTSEIDELKQEEKVFCDAV